MKDSLQPGLTYTHRFKIPESKTVPSLFPEADEFGQMPEVFATGYMVGLLEWACILCVNPHLDWPSEQTVGIHIDVSHEAATPPGFEVTVNVRLTSKDGRKLEFDVEAHDGVDVISRGHHQRYIIKKETFDQRLQEKHQAHFNEVLI